MKIIALLAISTCMLGCTKTDASLELNNWKVTEYTDENDEKTKNGIVCKATFNNGSLNMRLDVNGCFGTYEFNGKNEIAFAYGGGCTEICCDEPESIKAAFMLTSCTSYEIKGSKLTMRNNEGVEVILEAED